MLQHTLCCPQRIADSCLYSHHHLLYLEVLHAQLGFCPVLHLFAYALAGQHVLHDEDGLQHHRNSHDDGNARLGAQRIWP